MTTAATNRAHRYQRWSGELNKGRWTWLAIVAAGVRHTLKQRKMRPFFTLALSFVAGACLLLYGLSLLEMLAGNERAAGLYEAIRGVLRVDISSVARLGELREVLWQCVFFLMIKAQMFWVLLMLSWIGPGLIANDLKARALPIYFAKPVTPLTYLIGKWMTVAVFIAMVTLIPNLLSLLIGTLMTEGLETWNQTLALGLDLVLSGAMVCVVGGAIIVGLSSTTFDYRYAAVAWLAVCLLSVFAQAIIDDVLDKPATGLLGCISLWDNVLVLTDWLFGMRQAWEASSLPTEAFSRAVVKPVNPAHVAVVLAAWTVGAILVGYRRVVRFSRSAANV